MNERRAADLSQWKRISPAYRRRWEALFRTVCMSIAFLTVMLLVTLIGSILWQGLPQLNGTFLTATSSSDAGKAGILGALVGSVLVCLCCAIMTLPLGVATAIFLEEYKPKNRIVRWAHSMLELLISNLAGVPSVVYGLLGLSAFVHMFGLFGTIQDPAVRWGTRYFYQVESLTPGRMLLIPVDDADAPPPPLTEGMKAFTSAMKPFELHVVPRGAAVPTDREQLRYSVREGTRTSQTRRDAWYYLQLPFGYTVLAGAMTLMLVVLPVVIISSQEAIRAVPNSLRQAALGLGCTQWQVVRNVTLPSALPGIMTGAILAMSRAMGEAAPILLVSGVIFLSSIPSGLMSSYSIMPLQIYHWADHHEPAFARLAATGIIVLLVVLSTFNLTAVLVRQYTQRNLH